MRRQRLSLPITALGIIWPPWAGMKSTASLGLPMQERNSPKQYDFDATCLAPQVAAPGNPANAGDIANFADVPIDQAYIGACTGAKLEDLHFAAKVLQQRCGSAGRETPGGARLDGDYGSGSG